MVRLMRFAAGSLLATAASAGVFALVYRVGGTGPRAATFAAFAAGAVVSFVVNRSWTWNRRHRAGLRRDIAAFLAVVGSIAVLAAIATSVTESYAYRIGAGDGERTVLVETAYLGTYALMFLVKFVLLDRWVFRAQDENTTRA
jgi:putative flippase GtrA